MCTIRFTRVVFSSFVVLAATLYFSSFAFGLPTLVESTTVDFLEFAESSWTDPGATYGEPSNADDELIFWPGFTAVSSGGDSDLTDVRLKMEVQAHEGHGINTISISETGAYMFFGTGTAATNARALIPLATLSILEVDGNLISAIDVNAGWSGVSYQLPGDTFGGWSGGLTIDVAGGLVGTAYAGGLVTRVGFAFNNALYTQSEIGTTAFIDKKKVSIGVDTVVPEPGTMALLGVGALLGLILVWVRRRK